MLEHPRKQTKLDCTCNEAVIGQSYLLEVQLLPRGHFQFHIVKGTRERSPPLPKIAHPSLPRLGRSQASTWPSAMHKSPPGGTACLITVSSMPGKLTSLPQRASFILHRSCSTCGFHIPDINVADNVKPTLKYSMNIINVGDPLPKRGEGI